MRNHALEADLVERFSVTPTEARKMVEEAEAKAAVRTAVARASRGHPVEAKEADFEQPAVWRHEVHRRLAALDVMEEGIGCLQQLQKHIKAVIDAEQQLVQHKRAKVRDKQCDWWDLRDSGWAMGGRERFATYVGDIFRNLDEGQLGGRVMDRMGFKRSIPLPDIPEPVEEPVPQNAEELVAALTRPVLGGIGRVPYPVLKAINELPPKLQKLYQEAVAKMKEWVASQGRSGESDKHRAAIKAVQKLAKKSKMNESDLMMAIQHAAM